MDYSPVAAESVLSAPWSAALLQQRDACQVNLNTILTDYPAYQDMPLPQLLTCELEPAICCHVHHWGGGAYACDLAAQSLAAPFSTAPSPLLLGAIDRVFGSMVGLCRTLQNAAPGQAGFVWLSSNREGELQVNRTFQYATPLPLYPLLALPAGLFPSSGICERLNFSTASRRYAALLAQRSPHLYR